MSSYFEYEESAWRAGVAEQKTIVEQPVHCWPCPEHPSLAPAGFIWWCLAIVAGYCCFFIGVSTLLIRYVSFQKR